MTELELSAVVAQGTAPALRYAVGEGWAGLNEAGRAMLAQSAAAALDELAELAARSDRMQIAVVCFRSDNVPRAFECCLWPLQAERPAQTAWLCLLQPCREETMHEVGVRADGLLSICARCKRVRDGAVWLPLETYACGRLGLRLTHGLCPPCAEAELRSL